MAVMKCIISVLPVVVLLFYMQMSVVDSFVPYLPTETEDSAEVYDSLDRSEEQDETIEDKLLYKLLNSVLMEKVRKLAHAQNNGYYENSPDDSFMLASKRGLPELAKMIKRKIFWQPVGFMSTTVNHSGGMSKGSAKSSSTSQAGQPFRYG